MLLPVKKKLKLRIGRRKKSSDRIFKTKYFIWQKRLVYTGGLVYSWKKKKKSSFLLKKSFLTKKRLKNSKVRQYKTLIKIGLPVEFFKLHGAHEMPWLKTRLINKADRSLLTSTYDIISEVDFYRIRAVRSNARYNKLTLKQW